jgi:hypothetical protein
MKTRAALADAVRPFGPNGKLQAAHIPALDALADALGLPRDGVTDPTAPPQIGLSAQDFEQVAVSLGCEPAQIRAVWEVESGGGWFTDVRADILDLDGPGGFLDGPNLPKILFEAHVFDRETGGRFRKSHPNLSSATWNRALYVGGQGEYARLYRAMQLDRTAALRSASVGGAQIMGFNHKVAGFDTVDAFWSAMRKSERAHLDAFAAFIRNSGLLEPLRQISTLHEDCKPFARGYNGAGYWRHDPPYNVRIARAYKKWKGA